MRHVGGVLGVCIEAILCSSPLAMAAPPQEPARPVGSRSETARAQPAVQRRQTICEALAGTMAFLSSDAKRAWIANCEGRHQGVDVGSGLTSAFASVAIGGGVVHRVYTAYDAENGELQASVHYDRSTDGGATWAGSNLSQSSGISHSPSLAAAGLLTYVVWADNRDGNVEIYMRRSEDGGVTWSQPARATSAVGDSRAPSAVLSNGRLHVVWNDERSGDYEVYYRRGSPWESGGWDQEVRITETPQQSSMVPSLAADGATLHLVWQEGRNIAYVRSLDSGGSWQTPRRLSYPGDGPGRRSEHPSVVASNGRVNVFYEDNRWSSCTEGCFRLLQISSSSSGESWGEETEIDASESRCWQVGASMRGQDVWVVRTVRAEGTTPALDRVMILGSRDGGVSWPKRLLVANDTGGLWRASLAVDAGGPPSIRPVIHTMWTRQLTEFPHVFYAKRIAP